MTPGAVSGLSGATAITIGDFHACAVLSDGTARCWGYNAYQQLGDGTRADSGVPVLVTEATGISSMSASTDATCALLANGTYQCWG